MIELPKDKSIAQRCAVLNLDFDERFIGEDVKNTLEAANPVSYTHLTLPTT